MNTLPVSELRFGDVNSNSQLHEMNRKYWEEICQHKAAVTTPYGVDLFLTIPFGMSNSASLFARAIQNALGHLDDSIVILFQDDSLVLGTSFENHLKIWS